MKMHRFILVCALAALFTGCSSTKVEKEYLPPPLMIAQNADGEVTLAWESDPGYLYTVFYQSSAGGEWKGVSGAFRIAGTGEMLTVYDKVNPNRPPRRYRLLPEKAE